MLIFIFFSEVCGAADKNDSRFRMTHPSTQSFVRMRIVNMDNMYECGQEGGGRIFPRLVHWSGYISCPIIQVFFKSPVYTLLLELQWCCRSRRVNGYCHFQVVALLHEIVLVGTVDDILRWRVVYATNELRWVEFFSFSNCSSWVFVVLLQRCTAGLSGESWHATSPLRSRRSSSWWRNGPQRFSHNAIAKVLRIAT